MCAKVGEPWTPPPPSGLVTGPGIPPPLEETEGRGENNTGQDCCTDEERQLLEVQIGVAIHGYATPMNRSSQRV